MLRILHSVSNMDRAGVETMLMNYYRHMDTDLIQFDFLCNKKAKGHYDEEILKMGGRIFRSPGVNPMRYFEYMKYMKELLKKYPEYKILHAHNGSFAFYALHGARLGGMPVRIFHAHGAAIGWDWKKPLKLICKARLKGDVTHRWSCGKKAARFYFGSKVADSGDYHFLHNAIDVDAFCFDPAIRERMRRENELEGKTVIGHIGRFMQQKNHAFLLELFKEIKKAESSAVLVLLGCGELEEKMKKYAARLGIADSVKFCGNVNNANEWYQAFDVFVLPSLWEGLPVVGIEAQAAGLPCVFSTEVTDETDITGNVSFLELGEKKEHWARVILDKAKNSSRTDMREKIRAAGYDINVEAEKLQEIYKELCK